MAKRKGKTSKASNTAMPMQPKHMAKAMATYEGKAALHAAHGGKKRK
jgi:hypothetical protein